MLGQTLLVYGALGVLLFGCSAAAPSTDSGTIHIVDVAHEVEPRLVLAGQNHEVRWRNTLTESIRISFPFTTATRVSCNTGFKAQEPMTFYAVIEPNGSASLCFTNQGKYNYQVSLNQNPANPLTDKRAIVWVVGRGRRNPDPYEEYTNITP